MYDICIVGAGLIGSSAAKHLTELRPNIKVALIGPEEIKERSTAKVHGAHYDEGRITRVLDPNHIWATLAERSIQKYRDIEIKSGINFYSEIGFLAVGTKDGQYVESVKINAANLKQKVDILNEKELKRRYNFMDFGTNREGVFSSTKAGVINPRNLVKAQKKIAAMGGCDIINAVVNKITRKKLDKVEINLDTGDVITCHNVLIATGAFTECHQLLPIHKLPDIKLVPQTVAFVLLEEKDLHIYSNLSPLIIKGQTRLKDGTYTDDPNENFEAYILPPVKYPDGRFYMKIGHGENVPNLHSSKQIHNWYCQGKYEVVNQHMIKLLRKFFPDLSLDTLHFDYCVSAHTSGKRLYIDFVEPNIAVALGGNGMAAKSCDEIGRVAARLMVAKSWDYDLPVEDFRFRAKKNVATPTIGSKL